MQMKAFRVVVLQVKSRDSFGRPKAVEFVHDDDTVDLSDPGNREFITALIEPHKVAPRKAKARG